MSLPDADTHAILARLRAGDLAEIERAYKAAFSGPVGRFVLAHILAEAGVGRRFGGELTGDALAYHQGGHDVALEIMDRAGFDPSSAALMAITGQLEGQDHELSAQPDGEAVGEPQAHLPS